MKEDLRALLLLLFLSIAVVSISYTALIDANGKANRIPVVNPDETQPKGN